MQSSYLLTVLSCYSLFSVHEELQLSAFDFVTDDETRADRPSALLLVQKKGNFQGKSLPLNTFHLIQQGHIRQHSHARPKSHDKNDNVKNSPSKPNTRNGFQFLWIFLLFPLPVMLSNGLPLCAFLLLAQNPKVLCQRTTGLVIGASPASSNTGIVLHSSDLECILCSSFGIFCPGLAFSPCSLSILP